MAVNTMMLDFTVDQLKTEHNGKTVSVLKNYFPTLKQLYKHEFPDGGYSELFQINNNASLSLRGYQEGIITVTIDYYKQDKSEPILSQQQIASLELELRGALACKTSYAIPTLRRGGIQKCFVSSDERILEYDIDKLVFEEISPYQKVQIFHSKTFGNLLVLDGLQNLSDRDLIYTETLMQRGKENYEGKEIVILGGGDGALLYELLKEEPKNVVMLELDEVVIKACREHLREACGDILDNMKGPNYEIILGDCMKTLEVMSKEGKQVDYVFGDLTDVPVSEKPVGELWDFIRLILNSALRVLKPGGKYMTHCCGASSPGVLGMFESQLSQLDSPVTFTTDHAFVPSFLEDWVFYQLVKK